MKNELQRIRDQLKCSLNMGGLKGSAEWAVGELDRLVSGSVPVSVPDYVSSMGEAAQQYIDECCRGSDGQLLITPPRMPGGFYWYELFARMLAAAPTVKAEQWKCEQCGASTGEACNANGCFANERSADEAPSLPAAGSAVEEVEVVACIDLDTDVGAILYASREDHWLDNALLMTVAQHERIVAALNKVSDEAHAQMQEAFDERDAALSAQQSAPERVSVPVELLETAVDVLENAEERSTAAELRALLASHAEGGKV